MRYNLKTMNERSAELSSKAAEDSIVSQYEKIKSVEIFPDIRKNLYIQ